MKASYWHYALGETLARILPKRVAFLLAKGIAFFHTSFFSKDLSAVEDNMRAVLPVHTSQRDIQKAARRLFEDFSYNLVNLFYTRRFSLEQIRRCVETRGLEILDRQLAKEKGVILASAHLGHWELGGMTLAELGYPVHAVALKHRDKKINDVFQKRRDKNNLKIIPMNGSLKTCYQVLRQGKILGLVGDRFFSSTNGAMPVRFFGREMLFPRGIARLALATGASIVPLFFVMKGFDRYELEAQEPIEARDEAGIMQSFAARVEQKIREYPTQWFLFQRFWEKPEIPT